MSYILSLVGLNKVYDNGIHAVRDASFSIQAGEFVAVIGLSGSGKSSLLRCINRLVDPSCGQIFFRSQVDQRVVEVNELRGKDLRQYRRKIGMIFQHFNLVKRKSVLTNVLSGALGRSSTAKGVFELYTAEERELAMKYLTMVGLHEKAKNRADELSGGQQQRVAIARALMQDPEILLADEPVASLDPATSHSIMEYLEKANRELGKTIICNLHFLSLVRQYATRAIAMKKGEIVFDGKAHDIDEKWFRQIYGEDAREVEIR